MRIPKALITIFTVILIQVGGCSICSTTSPSAQFGLDCNNLYISGIQGIPYGPVTIYWNDLPNIDSYHLFLDGVIKDKPAISLGEATFDGPKFRYTFDLDGAKAESVVKEKRAYSVVLQSYRQGVLVCNVNKIFELAPAAKKSKAQPTETPAAQQPQQPPAEQPPAAVTPEITPCPPGFSGDPKNGISCLPIPR